MAWGGLGAPGWVAGVGVGCGLGGPCHPLTPHGWSAPGGLLLMLRKQPIWAAGDTPHLMLVGQGLPWHPVATGAGWPGPPLCCRCPPCARSLLLHFLVPCSRCPRCLPCLAAPLFPVHCTLPCPFWRGCRVLFGCVASPPFPLAFLGGAPSPACHQTLAVPSGTRCPTAELLSPVRGRRRREGQSRGGWHKAKVCRAVRQGTRRADTSRRHSSSGAEYLHH